MENDLSKFSIIIPTHNRPKQIVRCLAAISDLDYPKNKFEVIVVDDGATLSPEIVEKFQNKIDLIFHQQEQTGPAQARNKGAELSSFEFLVFTDDDCLPDKNWLLKFREQFTHTPQVCIGGRVVNHLKKNPFSSASHQLIDYLYDYFKEKNYEMFFFTSNNIALPKKILQNLEGFDHTFPLPAAEDRDFCKRLLERNFKLVYQPEAIVYHFHELNLRGFWRQHFNYGRGAYHFHNNLTKRTSGKSKSEPLDFYFQLLLFPLKKKLGLSSLKTAILLFISQTANVSGYLYQKLIRYY